jgi:hypothetical protein
MRLDINKDDTKNLRSFFDESHNHFMTIILKEPSRKPFVQKKIKQVLPLLAVLDNYGTIHEKFLELVSL